MSNNLFQKLCSKNFVHNSTNNVAKLFENKITFYVGFDPTGDSLHVGSLLPLMITKMFMDAGHEPIILIGNATGLIGDPSGKSKERNLLDTSVIEANTNAIREQIKSILGNSIKIVNNQDWFKDINFIEFLRDVGKHFRVNQMLQKDSVKKRLDSEEGISFTEFSYSLMQAFDFAHLANVHNCVLQMGGSDQWGNIVSGIDLTKKLCGKEVRGITFPLITKKDGSKFGKTEEGNIWLDSNKTSPFKFYQFFMQLSDDEVKQFGHTNQEQLAFELTSFVHGQDVAKNIQESSRNLFKSNNIEDLPEELVFKIVANISLIDLLISCKMASSKTNAKTLIQQNSVKIDDIIVNDEKFVIDIKSYKNQFVLQKGKKNKMVIKC